MMISQKKKIKKNKEIMINLLQIIKLFFFFPNYNLKNDLELNSLKLIIIEKS